MGLEGHGLGRPQWDKAVYIPRSSLAAISPVPPWVPSGLGGRYKFQFQLEFSSGHPVGSASDQATCTLSKCFTDPHIPKRSSHSEGD